MDHQQIAEYIDQCRRTIAADDAAYRKCVRDHEAKAQRIALYLQLEIQRFTAGVFEQARAAPSTSTITVAM